MKKILFLVFTPNNSGGEIIIRNLIQANNKIISWALVDKNYNKKMSKNDIKTKYIQKLNRDSLNFILYLFKAIYLSFGLTATILRLQKKYDFDVIYANTLTIASYGILARIISLLIYPKVKFIWHNHTINYLNGRWDQKMKNVLLRIYDRTIVVSQAVFNTMRYSKSISILYNGVDTFSFRQNNNTRQKLRIKYSVENKIIIGIFGTISYYKGQEQLFEAYQEIVKDFDSVHLFIIGSFSSNEIRKRIIKVANKLGKERVTILDFVENISDYYLLIDILVNNTVSELSEPLGTTILEGMSSEKIVIASNTGGSSEIIRDGIDGFLFKPDSVEELKNKIKYVIDNFGNLHYIKKNARQRIVQKFTIEKMVTSFNKIIDQI